MIDSAGEAAALQGVRSHSAENQNKYSGASGKILEILQGLQEYLAHRKVTPPRTFE
jgi:hypothetical protein